MATNQTNQTNTDVCSICYENGEGENEDEENEENEENGGNGGNGPMVTLPECGHKYHMNCILTWFRSDHADCPLCRTKPNMFIDKTDATIRFQILKLYSTKPNAPPKLVKDFKNYTRMVKRHTDRKRKRQKLRKELKKLQKKSIIKSYLKKAAQASSNHDDSDHETLLQKEYVIGCTDYGTDLMALSRYPRGLHEMMQQMTPSS